MGGVFFGGGGGVGHGIVENSALLWLSGKGEVGEAVYV